MSSTRTLQLGISWVLRVGLAISLALESAGVRLNYIHTGDSTFQFDQSWLAGGKDFFSFAWTTMVSAASAVTPLSLVSLGIVVLMLTPYVRVVTSVLYYACERDWKFVGITLVVLVIITLGLLVL